MIPAHKPALKINVSIHDFAPLLRGHEFLFKNLKATGVDGVELLLGFKSRWRPAHYRSLAEKYRLPIASLHQPLWAGMGLYFDERFFAVAHELGATRVVCHPLPKLSLQSPRMQKYFKRLAALQNLTGIDVLVENLPEQYNHKALNFFFPPAGQTGDVLALHAATAEHGLKMTLDIDHLQSPDPHKELWFEAVLPSIGNIHLSSFGAGRRHLPLYLGDFHAADFVQHLTQANYPGLLTFEINHPAAITLVNYNFVAIKRSVDTLR